MFIRLTKNQQWHITDTPPHPYVKTRCGRDYNYQMALKTEDEKECEGNVCRACLKCSAPAT